MIKKILLPILLFLTSFMIIDNVCATDDNSNTVYFDIEHSSYTSVYNSIQPKLEEIVSYINNNNPNNHKWVVYFGKDNSGAFVFVNLLPSDFVTSFISNFYSYCSSTAYSYSGSYYYVSGGCQTRNTPIKKYTFRSNDDISSLKTDLSLSYGSISGKSAGSQYMQLSGLNKFNFINNQYDYFSNNTNFILPYASSIRLYNYDYSTSSSMAYYKIQLGAKELSRDANYYLEPSNNYVDILKPLSLNVTLEDYELMGDYYSSLTYKLTFSEFDTSKYKYYYTFDGENIDQQVGRLLANPINENDTLLTFEMNTTFYIVVYNLSGEQVLLYSYSVNDIMNSRYDESLDVLDKHPDLPDKIDETTDITDNFTVANLIGWFRGLIDKRLPILNQITGIYKAFKFDINTDSDCIEDTYEYDPEKGYIWRSYCNKLPELNLKGIFGIDKSFEIIDVRFFLQYREQVFFWIKLSLGTYTVFKLFRIVASYFKQ